MDQSLLYRENAAIFTNMKSTGFSLTELLIVMLLSALLFSFGFNAYTNSKIKTEIRVDQQHLLQLPAMVEHYFSARFAYPGSIGEVLTPINGEFATPKGHYTIDYALSADGYVFTATARSTMSHTMLNTCHRLAVYSSGQLEAFDTKNNDTSAVCWN